MQRRDFLGAALTATAVACRTTSQPASRPGEIRAGGTRMIPVAGGKYRVWTRRVGSGSAKVLLLHGGPGINHRYLECFADFLPQEGIETYFYDQLGSVFSDNPDDPSLWTIERYTNEVEEVRQGLGLENFVLYGHSWGGMLAYEYALKHGSHLKSMIVSDMVAGIPAYVTHAAKLRAEFPPDVQQTMEKYEAAGQYDAPEYQRIIFENLYTRHLCRLDPWPEPVERSLRFINNKIYNYMQGPNEFVITGTMKNWDRTADLKNIRTKALVIGARYDTMDPDEMRRIAAAMPNARAAISDKGSHLCMYDDQAWYFDQVLRFLKETA